MSKRQPAIDLTPSSRPKECRLQDTTSRLRDIIGELNKQQPDNELVKQLQTTLEDHIQHLTSLLESVSNFESPEEKERKRSIVVIGLSEPTDNKASDRIKSDASSVEGLLDVLNVAAAPVSIYRMGHPDPNRFPQNPRKGPRVLKVVLPSNGIQRQVLAALKFHRNDLKENENYSRCFIRPSLSPEERELDKAARAELKRRKQAGEKKLFIKNFKVYSSDEHFGDL